MTKTTVPAEVFHPSVFILEEMDERGWDRDMVAMRMSPEFGKNRLTLDLYLDLGPEKTNMRLGEKTTTALARAFGTSAEFWTNLEAAWLRGVQNV